MMYGPPPASETGYDWDTNIPTLCAFMGFNAPLPPGPFPPGVPEFLAELTRKKSVSSLHQCFQAEIALKFCDHDEHFQNFTFSANLPGELKKMAYGVADPKMDWHKGLLPAVAMHRQATR